MVLVVAYHILYVVMLEDVLHACVMAQRLIVVETMRLVVLDDIWIAQKQIIYFERAHAHHAQDNRAFLRVGVVDLELLVFAELAHIQLFSSTFIPCPASGNEVAVFELVPHDEVEETSLRYLSFHNSARKCRALRQM